MNNMIKKSKNSINYSNSIYNKCKMIFRKIYFKNILIILIRFNFIIILNKYKMIVNKKINIKNMKTI